jgi:hypothetical protein
MALNYDYPIVSLDTDNPVFADVEMADAYLSGAYHADNWRTLDDDSKGRALVTATRTLDRQEWLGVKTDDLNELDWPRKDTGVIGVDPDLIPVDIQNATIELALSLTQGSDVQNYQSANGNIQTLRAGSASITYFRGGGNGGTPTRFPQIVWELVEPYLSGGAGSANVGLAPSQSAGTQLESVTGKDFGYTQGL